jgi:hypothetical protein
MKIIIIYKIILNNASMHFDMCRIESFDSGRVLSAGLYRCTMLIFNLFLYLMVDESLIWRAISLLYI